MQGISLLVVIEGTIQYNHLVSGIATVASFSSSSSLEVVHSVLRLCIVTSKNHTFIPVFVTVINSLHFCHSLRLVDENHFIFL